MKKTIITLLLLLSAMAGQADDKKIISRSEGSITFVVDENLTPIEDNDRYFRSGRDIAERILSSANIPSDTYHILATSFADEESMRYFGEDTFFQTIVNAYSNHKSIMLSPDMIWLLISQGFARYVNAHSEEIRSQLVNHSDKMDLVIESGTDLLSGQADWPSLIDGFASQIGKFTKGDIAMTIAADFSTTSQAEAVASKITLMESMKSFFSYEVIYVSCGIPSITLKGTPDDWQRVLDKTRRLAPYGLEGWTKSLEPILKEFVSTAEGKPRQKFWKGIVKKQRVKDLKGGACNPEKPTKLDGWILQLFPDENGNTRNSVYHTEEMPSERVRVGFRYRVFSPVEGKVTSETPMELWAGFIGTKEDIAANMLIPKIGWLVRMSESDDELLSQFREMDEVSGINLIIEEVPEVLSRMKHIESLSLTFTDAVVLPEWLDDITIDYFTIKGKMTDAEKAEIQRRFPKAVIR